QVLKVLNIKAPLAEIFRRPTIRELSRYILAEEKSHYAAVTAAEEKEYYPLSPGQKRLYLVYRMDVENTGYNITTALELDGNIDIEKLQATFRELVRRHESFRTSFFLATEEPVQRIHPPAEVEFEIQILGGRGQGLGVRPFDLSSAPLLRVGLERIDEKKHLLLVDMHHIIADGVSMATLVKEFTALYAGAHLPALKLRYRDYAEWRNRGKNDADKRQENFWLMQFETGDIPVLSLPLDYPRPTIQDFAGANLRFEINEEDAGALRSLAVKEDITLFMLLLALFNLLLAKLSGQQDIIVGSPTAGRNHADLQDIIGMFVNTLALRNFPIAEKPFNHFLQEVKERTLTAFENQEYPFENLVERLKVNRDTGRNPLFDVAFVSQNMDVPEVHIPGLKTKPHNFEKETSIFDITWQTFESSSRLLFIIEFSTKLFKPETIQRFTGYWLNLLKQACLNPTARAMDMDILSPEEKNLLLYGFNETEYEYPEHKTIHELFMEQVDKTPDNVALVWADSQIWPITLSYNELNDQSDRLAGLIMEKGVLPDSIVGIMIERSVTMIIGILGILKAGGAYLPIDPSYPQDRIDYMLADSNAKILLGAEECRKEIIINCQLLIVNCKLKTPRSMQAPLHHSNLSYIIYTSGTTGRPKGVMVEHRSVVRLVKNTDYVEFRENDRILQTGALEFDASTFEIWGALLNGLMLFLVEKEHVLSPLDLRNAVEKYDIRTMWLTSSLFNRLSEADIEIFAPLRNLLVGGEALSPLYINKLRTRFTQLNIINGYGPTENTTFSTTYRINREFKDNIPIGRPIANSTAYIVDRWNRLQPLGVAGELQVGGHGVARGYLNNVELTAEKFDQDLQDVLDDQDVKNKSFAGVKGGLFQKPPLVFYKTGDLCRWLPCGNIEFLGRIDGQVKLRGFRIELSEIESRLTAYKGIKEAVVVLKEKNLQSYLCAYFVPVREAAVSGLREYLSGKLPAYMIPSYFVPMDRIPLTPNGKVDRKALPDPDIKSGNDYVAPSDETEWKLAEIWSEVLGISKDIICIYDDFFQLGGHSL
ncbi:MAG: hypothetical protein QG657_4583, partial [Acidobacteriota bacterium]|nr:hypothetical protein [Acidobacteriota bacterium]